MEDLVSVLDFEKRAFETLPRTVLDYYRSGAGKQETLRENRKSFNKFKLRPRCLRNVEERDLSTVVLGEKVSMPIGIAPTAMQKMAHTQGECANARAAESLGTIFTLSTLSTSSIEEVAKAAPNAVKWYQLYIYKDRNVTRDLVSRAERAGFKALVLTVDAPVFGLRLADLKNKFSLPDHLSLANFRGIKATGIRNSGVGSGLNNYVNGLFDSTITWDDVKWLRSITSLPIVLKGIMTAEDALLAVEAGVAAVQVSNHGARQIDGTAASIEALSEIVQAVGGKVEVYVDGGITDGVDVLKALALGAKMAFVGRAALWGLVCGGREGVEKVLGILKNELSTAMAIAGFSRVGDLERNLVVHEGYYSKM
ncbi:unnamed protein product [Phyllotreta striolata]|uniref:(S)-2-hydroxy-acid oxidase n=1 Tax=Phyllotreta striolata TaxID=444603 RepID=A0A9N9XS09_PHYSR|nr:unnamed protein product [Phyllotreta striolata]